MTFLKTVKLTTLTLLLLLFTNNSYVNAFKALKFKKLFDVFNTRCLNWNYDTQSLYFSDEHAIFRYDYYEDRLYNTENSVNGILCVLPVDSSPNLYAISSKRQVDIVEWDGRSKNYQVISTLFELPNLNVGDEYQYIVSLVADKKGRLYAGSGENNPVGYGCFYTWETGLQNPITLFCDVTDPLGIAFDYLRKKFYYIDTYLLRIDVFDYDEETGGISNRNILYDFNHGTTYAGFYPNALAIDKNGLLIVPTYGDYQVIFVDPVNKTIVRTFNMGCKFLFSVGFGGPNLNTLFVGSSKYFREPPCGETIAVSCLGTSGVVSGKLKI